MREIRTSGLTSGDGKRGDAGWPKPAAPVLDSTRKSVHRGSECVTACGARPAPRWLNAVAAIAARGRRVPGRVRSVRGSKVLLSQITHPARRYQWFNASWKELLYRIGQIRSCGIECRATAQTSPRQILCTGTGVVGL